MNVCLDAAKRLSQDESISAFLVENYRSFFHHRKPTITATAYPPIQLWVLKVPLLGGRRETFWAQGLWEACERIAGHLLDSTAALKAQS